MHENVCTFFLYKKSPVFALVDLGTTLHTNAFYKFVYSHCIKSIYLRSEIYFLFKCIKTYISKMLKIQTIIFSRSSLPYTSTQRLLHSYCIRASNTNRLPTRNKTHCSSYNMYMTPCLANHVATLHKAHNTRSDKGDITCHTLLCALCHFCNEWSARRCSHDSATGARY
jgi:hypothetical protein